MEGTKKIKCTLESNWCRFLRKSCILSIPPLQPMKLTRRGMECRGKIEEGEERGQAKGRRRENKEVIVCVCVRVCVCVHVCGEVANLISLASIVHCKLVALRGSKSAVHFPVTIVREISRGWACFYLRNNEECVLVQTLLYSCSRSSH